MNKVLIIEDDDDILDVVDYILIGCGYKVFTSNQKLNIEAVIALKPDLIIIDHILGNGFGGDLCLELKDNEQTKQLPVILMSAQIKLSEIALRSCADAYIVKPFDLNEFEGIVEKLINK